MDWIQNPQTEPEKFINRFMKMTGDNEDFQECMRTTFRAGYCWYFAHMLQEAFGRGLVCLTAPFGHFVWLDTSAPPEKVTFEVMRDCPAYDIEGRYYMQAHEAIYLIPEDFLGDTLESFKHVEPKKDFDVGKEITDGIRMIKNFCRVTGCEYYKEVEYILYENAHFWDAHKDTGTEDVEQEVGL